MRKISKRVYCFFAFGSRNCLLSTQFYDQVTRRKNGMCASANAKCITGDIATFVLLLMCKCRKCCFEFELRKFEQRVCG